MNLTYTRPGELRKPDVKVLPDGRIRVTRYIAAGHGDRDLSEVTESFGTNDSGLNTALLVEKGMARIEGKDAIVKTWEVRNPTGETPVGNEDVQWGENGLKTVIADFVQMSTQPYTPQTVGVTASTYDATCILRNEVMDDDGSTRQIRRFYINKGLLKQVDETRNNGALLIRSLTYLNDTPSGAIISGYTLINQNRDNPSGLPTTTYTYAKGTGQVSQDDETKNNGALLIRNIRYLSVPSVVVNPITTPTGYTKISESYVEQDGHKVWTATYAKGTGNVSYSLDYRNKGKLVIYKQVYLGSAPSTPSSTIGGTVVLISSDVRQQDGYELYDYTWAEGYGTISSSTESHNQGKLKIYDITSLAVDPATPSATIGGTVVLIQNNSREESGVTIYSKRWAEGVGVIEKRTQPREGGLRVETWVSIGQSYDASFMLPAGILALRDSDDIDGITRWTVSCFQKSDGTTPITGTALSYTTKRSFTYPGRAKAYSTSITVGYLGVKTNYDVFKSPPVPVLVDATIDITYQTTNSIGLLPYTLWNPTTWATIRSWYLTWNAAPGAVVESLPNYRAEGGTSTVTFNGGSTGYQESAFGNRLYGYGGGSPYFITVSGGPSAPDSGTYVIEPPTIEPAFIGYDGTQYYRRIIVSATIPAQPSLPV